MDEHERRDVCILVQYVMINAPLSRSGMPHQFSPTDIVVISLLNLFSVSIEILHCYGEWGGIGQKCQS
jgi:hypothetical protein